MVRKLASEAQVIRQYCAEFDRLLKQYPDGYYCSPFQRELDELVSRTYADWCRTRQGDRAFWDIFCRTYLMDPFVVSLPKHFPDDWEDELIPEDPMEKQEEERFEQQQAQIQRQKDWGVYVEPGPTEEQKRLRTFLNDLESDDTDVLKAIRKRQGQ
jgi:uncharacterized membrane protein